MLGAYFVIMAILGFIVFVGSILYQVFSGSNERAVDIFFGAIINSVSTCGVITIVIFIFLVFAKIRKNLDDLKQ